MIGGDRLARKLWETQREVDELRAIDRPGVQPVYNVVTMYGALGDDSTNNSTAINNAITDAASAGGGVVLVPFVPDAENYRVGAKLEMAAGVTLVLDAGVKLKPTANIDVVQMAPGAALLGPGTIDTSVIGASFSNACVHLDGSDQYNLDHGTFIGGGLKLVGTSNRVGRGIEISVAGTASDNVTFVNFDNILIVDFALAIRIDVVKPASGVSYANGNQFSNVIVARCPQGIHMDGGDDLRANGNTFSNIQFNTHSASTRVLYVRGLQNQFINFMVWDPHNGLNEDLILFANDSERNYFGGWVWRLHIRDYGKDNIIDNRHGWPPLRRTIVPPGNVHAASYVPDNDYLALCDLRSGVTVTETGTTPSVGTISRAFDTDRNVYAQYNSGGGIASTAAVIEVDLGETLDYLHAVGVNFAFDRMAQEVKIEAWDGSAWNVLYETTQNGNNQVMVDTQQSASIMNHAYRADKLRFTLKVAHHSSGDVYLERLWAYYGDRNGLAHRKANLLFGELGATPANPENGTECKLYMKADKLVIQYNDGGTVRYKYLDLTGTGVTWQHTTTAP